MGCRASSPLIPALGSWGPRDLPPADRATPRPTPAPISQVIKQTEAERDEGAGARARSGAAGAGGTPRLLPAPRTGASEPRRRPRGRRPPHPRVPAPRAPALPGLGGAPTQPPPVEGGAPLLQPGGGGHSDASTSRAQNPLICASLFRAHVGKLRPRKEQKVAQGDFAKGGRAGTKTRGTWPPGALCLFTPLNCLC